MVGKLLAPLCAAALLLAACTSTRQMADVEFTPPAGEYSLLVLRPNVSVGLLTASGLVEPREDWTEQARTNLIAALQQQQAGRGGRTVIASTFGEAGADASLSADLSELHGAVGQAIYLHKYSGLTLPTMEDRFDWTLGDQAVRLGRQTGYDYALFLHAEDQFSSSGRVALRVLGFAGCMIGVCVIPGGKTRMAYASLVDLGTGRIVWFNLLTSGVGDMRTPEGANDTISDLLAEMRPGAAVRAAAEAEAEAAAGE